MKKFSIKNLMEITSVISLILTVILIAIIPIILTSCTEAERVRNNLAQEADNFNVVRRVTVIDCITGDTLLQLSGRCSITADTTDNQLEVIVETQKGYYQKQIIGLSDNVTYIIEDLEVSDVSEYQYELNFNPKMWLPVKPDVID